MIYFSVTTFFKEKWQNELKEKIKPLFHKQKEEEKDFFKTQEFSKPIEIDETLHSKFGYLIGGWSEMFVSEIINLKINQKYIFVPKNFSFPQEKVFTDMDDEISQIICSTLTHFLEQKKFHFGTNINEKEDLELLLFFHYQYFESVINHFIFNVAPLCEGFVHGSVFAKKPKKSKWTTEIRGWLLDFYDEKNNALIEFKFSKEEFKSEWFWQVLTYSYLIYYHHGIVIEKIKIFNTYLCQISETSLEDIFGKDGVKNFLITCESEINCGEKSKLIGAITRAHQYEYKEGEKLWKFISGNYETENKNEIEKYIQIFQTFFKKLDNREPLDYVEVWKEKARLFD